MAEKLSESHIYQSVCKVYLQTNGKIIGKIKRLELFLKRWCFWLTLELEAEWQKRNISKEITQFYQIDGALWSIKMAFSPWIHCFLLFVFFHLKSSKSFMLMTGCHVSTRPKLIFRVNRPKNSLSPNVSFISRSDC